MKGWVMTALLVTFLSGTSTGFLVGRNTVPTPEQPTWIDGAVATLAERGVTDPAALEKARGVYEEFEKKVLSMKSRVLKLLKDQLTALENDAERQIREIMSTSAPGSAGAKEK